MSEADVKTEELVSNAETTKKVRKRRYIIRDFDNEPLRIFNTKVDAEWFVKDKPDCSIKVETTVVEVKVEKKLTDYERAMALNPEPAPF